MVMKITSRYTKSTIKQLWIQKVKSGIYGVHFVIDIIEILISELKVNLDEEERKYVNEVKTLCSNANSYKKLITNHDDKDPNFIKYKKYSTLSYVCLDSLYKIFWKYGKDTDIERTYITTFEFSSIPESNIKQDEVDDDKEVNIIRE